MSPLNPHPHSIRISRIVRAVLFSVLILHPTGTGSAQALQTAQAALNSPSAVVKNFHAVLLDVMKNAKTLGIKGRYKKLTPNVAEVYDLSRWIRLATGRYWRKANQKQKQQLKSAFNKMSAATYASQFNSYSGESFKTIGERAGPRDSILIETQIRKDGKKKAGLTYVAFKVNGQWRIVDILLDNKISQLAVRRSEYRGILKQSGINGLVTRLEEITKKLLAS